MGQEPFPINERSMFLQNEGEKKFRWIITLNASVYIWQNQDDQEWRQTIDIMKTVIIRQKMKAGFAMSLYLLHKVQGDQLI